MDVGKSPADVRRELSEFTEELSLRLRSVRGKLAMTPKTQALMAEIHGWAELAARDKNDPQRAKRALEHADDCIAKLEHLCSERR